MEMVLAAEGVHKNFAGVHALVDARVAVARGEVHALMGENGAGKSTLGKVLAGVFRPDAGRILIDGQPVMPADPLEAQRLGVCMIFQELDLFPHLTVAENIAAGNLHFREGLFTSPLRLAAACEPYLARVGLEVPAECTVGELSLGQMQLVAIARALSMDARVIVMDEATSSLTDDAVARLFRLVGQLRDAGVSVIYVSHKLAEIFRIADRVTVLRDGRTIGTLRTAETDADELVRMMVGRDLRGRVRAATHAAEEVLLEVRGLSTARLHHVGFELRRGEVLGIAGLVGSGRSEIGRALFGLDPLSGGDILLRGRPYRPRGPRQAMDCGLGLLPEDRKLAGLMMQMSVRENASLSALSDLSHGGWVRPGAERQACERVAASTCLRAASHDHAVSSLSGGNQQKVLLGRWLLVDPEVLFLDDPTRGVDVGAKEDIYVTIERLAATGKGVMMVSSELPELLRCCDRILVLHDGRAVGALDATDATQEEIMALATAAAAAEAGRTAG